MIRVTRSAVIDAPIERVWGPLRPDRLRAPVHPPGREPDPRAAPVALGPGSRLDILHPRRERPPPPVRGHAAAEAGDGWGAHVLALAVHLRRAARSRARAGRDGRHRSLRGWLRGPARVP